MQRHLVSSHEHTLDACPSVLPTRVAAAHPQFGLSTYQPTNADIVRIQDILEKEREVSRKYDKEARILKQKLRQVEAGKSVVEENISTCLSALSVCRRLPVEIWELIFSCYVSLYAHSFIVVYDHKLGHEIIKMPLITLSRVCQSWRSIVQGCPALWSTIDLALVQQLDRKVRDRLEFHLKHSKEHPLQVRLQSKEILYPHRRYGSTTQRSDSWKLLCSHMNRWQSLTLGRGYNNLPQVDNPSLPNLTSLIIEASYSRYSNSADVTGPDRGWLSQVLHNSATPRLEFIQLDHLDQVDELPSCSRLTKLHVQNLRVDSRHGDRTPFPLNLLHTLEACNNLHSLSVTVNFDDYKGQCTRPTLTESLTIRDRTPFDSGTNTISPLQSLFCSSITASSLADVELICRSRSAPVYFDMFTRPTPPLTRLKLEISKDPGYKPFPTPGKYKKVVGPFVGDLLSKFKVPTFLPMLSSIFLGIQDISVTNEIIDAVLEIALQRQAAVVPLRSFCLIRLTSGDQPRKLATSPQKVVDRINELRQTFGVRVEYEERHYSSNQESLSSHAPEVVSYSDDDVIIVSSDSDEDVVLGVNF
ncbi:hypothetical protein PQX77_014037 [Marasmius sp. AFHP31]|nr:hypothetical protein PQX77_014037 [Marasmius sp. AFHP31]